MTVKKRKKVLNLIDYSDLNKPYKVPVILVVEFNEHQRANFTRILEAEGCNVHLAIDAREMSEKLEATIVDLLLINVNLPGLDGLECCKLLKGHGILNQLPLIIFSVDSSSKSVVDAAISFGCDDFINKPFENNNLIKSIKKLIPNFEQGSSTEVNSARRIVSKLSDGSIVDICTALEKGELKDESRWRPLFKGLEVNPEASHQLLCSAIKVSHVGVLRLLLQRNFPADPPVLEGRSNHFPWPLLFASISGCIISVRVLLEYSANPNRTWLVPGTKSSTSPLVAALQHEGLEIVRLLLRSGADPNLAVKIEDDFYTPLHAALNYRRQEAALLLIDAGADVTIRVKGNATILIALKLHCFKVVDRMLSFDWSIQELQLAASIATEDKNLELANQLSTRIESFNSPSVGGVEKLHKLEDNHNEEITTLIGQPEARRAIEKVVAQASVAKERERRGLQVSKPTLHALFLGPPGTGKTSFARAYAQALKSCGILRVGHLIEVARSDLIGEYLGQTAPKTMACINKALGGVLFIDEAYSLRNGDRDIYGTECIATLVKAMEDFRNDLVVICAGYHKEMDEFIAINPGLRSRFPHTIVFGTYSAMDALEISERMVRDSGLVLVNDARSCLLEFLGSAPGAPFCANGRDLRNLIEEAGANLSLRLAKGDLTRMNDLDLKSVLKVDLEMAICSKYQGK